ncbi:MAG: hypothetical protein HQM08_30940 [Candidatus Riflebacteria bacterium]|nr:hypothetical protein [Candidatus Riflebacteria bacterium]
MFWRKDAVLEHALQQAREEARRKVMQAKVDAVYATELAQAERDAEREANRIKARPITRKRNKQAVMVGFFTFVFLAFLVKDNHTGQTAFNDFGTFIMVLFVAICVAVFARIISWSFGSIRDDFAARKRRRQR